MACLLLGILPFFEDLAFDAGLDILCPPAGGSKSKSYISYQSFSNMMYDNVRYVVGRDQSLDKEIYRLVNDSIEKCLMLVMYITKPISSVASRNTKCAQTKKYVSVPQIRKFFIHRNKQLSEQDLLTVQNSINYYLSNVLIK